MAKEVRVDFLEIQFWDSLNHLALLASYDFRIAAPKALGRAERTCQKFLYRNPEGGACGWGRWSLGGPGAQSFLGKAQDGCVHVIPYEANAEGSCHLEGHVRLVRCALVGERL